MKVNPRYVLRKIGEQGCVLPVGPLPSIQENRIVMLNETGIFLWENMNREVSLNELVNLLIKEYDVDYQEAETDIKEFIKICETNRLLI